MQSVVGAISGFVQDFTDIVVRRAHSVCGQAILAGWHHAWSAALGTDRHIKVYHE